VAYLTLQSLEQANLAKASAKCYHLAETLENFKNSIISSTKKIPNWCILSETLSAKTVGKNLLYINSDNSEHISAWVLNKIPNNSAMATCNYSSEVVSNSYKAFSSSSTSSSLAN